MATLHTINQSPDRQLLGQCLPVCSPGDALLFIEDGVYHGIQSAELARLPEKMPVFVLREDARARGLQERIPRRCEQVSMRKFVQMCCDFDRIVSWY